jgi:hypothetical protein
MEAVYSPLFLEDELALSDTVYDSVESSIDVLLDHPGLAADYDPLYDHDLPPTPCKRYYVPQTTKVIYLSIDEDKGRLNLLLLADARQDPRTTFSRMRNEKATA